MGRTPSQGPRRERGQALVETALSMLIVLLLLAGLVDFGLAFGYRVALFNAARAGARYGVRYPTVEYNVKCITLQALAGTMVLTDAEGSCALTIDATNPLPDPWPDDALTITVGTVDASGDGSVGRGDEITVTVTYDYDPIFVGLLGGGPFTLASESTMMIAGLDILYEP